MLKGPLVFYADRHSAGTEADTAITHHATQMLRRIARDLRLRSGEHENVTGPVRRNRGCRVTLRTHAVMLEVADTPFMDRNGRKANRARRRVS